MEKDDINLSDWQRILFGNAPVEFLLEVILRTLITYFFLLVVIRLLGKRMSGQLTSTEMAVMLLLGAIVSVPMQSPDRGLVQGFFMLLLILGLQQGFAIWMRQSKKVEHLVQGSVSILVKEGVLQMPELDRLNISREQLFGVLRGQHIYNLGRVKRLYLEPAGDFNTYERDGDTPGLSILPRKDKGMHAQQQRMPEKMVCTWCGHLEQHHPHRHCANCGHQQWEAPVI